MQIQKYSLLLDIFDLEEACDFIYFYAVGLGIFYDIWDVSAEKL